MPATAGAATAPAAASAAGTSQPAARAGTTTRAAGTTPTQRASPPTRATRLAPRGIDATNGATVDDRIAPQRRFGGNPGMFDRGPLTGAPLGRVPGSALPGRANLSGGSTGATFTPAAPIAGGPNPGDRLFTQGNAPVDAPLAGNSPVTRAAENNIRAAMNAPLAPVVPTVPPAPQTSFAPSASVAPRSTGTTIAPTLPIPPGTEISGRTGIETGIPITPSEFPVEQQGVATATAFPTRNPTATGDATVRPSPQSLVRPAESDFAEVPGGGEPRTTSYRGNVDTTRQGRDLDFVYPGYTLWQGYYWYHSPAAGWHYWDGVRWVRFENGRSAQRSAAQAPRTFNQANEAGQVYWRHTTTSAGSAPLSANSP